MDITQQIENVTFSPFVQSWIDRYAKVGKRGEYLWKWCYVNVRLVTLSCVPANMVDHLTDTKMLHLVVLCLLDDIVDERQDSFMWDTAKDILTHREDIVPYECFSIPNQDYLHLLSKAWVTLWNLTTAYKCNSVYIRDIHSDYEQVIRALDHSLAVNLNPHRINLAEAELYQPHNMAMIYMGMLDLCASPSFDPAELGRLREVLYYGQIMGRIGNSLATWERELESRDFSSVYFATAVSLGRVTAAQLLNEPVEVLRERLETHSIVDELEHKLDRASYHLYRESSKLTSVDGYAYYLACCKLKNTHTLGKGKM